MVVLAAYHSSSGGLKSQTLRGFSGRQEGSGGEAQTMASKIYWFNLYHTFLLPFLIAIQIIFKVKPKHFDRQGNNLLNAIFVSA